MVSQKPLIMTVSGSVEPNRAGITDAHNHVWIDRVSGETPDAPVLNDLSAILEELVDYRRPGGVSIVDCQPGGCERDGRKLRELAATSGVNIIACSAHGRSRIRDQGRACHRLGWCIPLDQDGRQPRSNRHDTPDHPSTGKKGFKTGTIRKLTGENVAQRLAFANRLSSV